MNELEQKRQRFEKIAKVVGLGVAGLLFAPFAAATITGLVSLLVVATLGLLTVNIGIPVGSRLMANWRLKALKAVAAANPIETLENRYSELKDSLMKQRDNIKARIAVASKIFSQIKSFESQFSKPSPRRDSYDKLNQLIELSKGRYQKAQLALVDFGHVIEEKRADWEIVQSMNEANKLQKAGEDFTSKLMADTALNTVQTGLDTAFAELDAAVMDENIDKLLSGQDVQINVASTAKVDDKKPVKSLTAPSDLDFDAEPVGTNRQKIALS
jgi:hypothetical protein